MNILHCPVSNSNSPKFKTLKYTVIKKTNPYSSEHNFDKYCPTLIILSVLQTEFNSEQDCQIFSTKP